MVVIKNDNKTKMIAKISELYLIKFPNPNCGNGYLTKGTVATKFLNKK